MDKKNLLTSKQMAQFVADGYLRFDEIVSDDLNRRAYSEMQDKIPRAKAGTPFNDIWHDTAIGEVFGLPQVQGIINSLVGPNPIYDHHAAHKVQAHKSLGQHWHADAIIDTRQHFDIQFFYFVHDTPRKMGGTMILPGSHFRRISNTDIARYQNLKGQLPIVCNAGTIFVVHHGIWHCAQPNQTDTMRFMFKLRLNPTVRQNKLWNTDDIDDPGIRRILGKNHGWYGNESRIETVIRGKFWRFLTGNENYDANYYLTRFENRPEIVTEAV